MVSNNKIDKIMDDLNYVQEIVINPFNKNKIVWYRSYNNLISRNEIKKILTSSIKYKELFK
jgi:hypothetical protein